MRHALKGRTLTYVDDLVGVCLKSNSPSQLSIARRIITQLLGPGSVADEKIDSAWRLEVIGFTIDLGVGRVLISRMNHLET